MPTPPSVRIEPWGPEDLPLLERLQGDPRMTVYLGGPESHEKIIERQARYERLAESGKGKVFKIIEEGSGEAVGGVVYWDRTEGGEDVYEIGWSVIPEFQGRGIAASAVRLAIASARAEGKHRFLYAFPSVENGPSNAICRKLGFTLLDKSEFEYPKGHFMVCNIWRLDLFQGGSTEG